MVIRAVHLKTANGDDIVKDEEIYPEDDTPAYLMQVEFEAQVVPV